MPSEYSIISVVDGNLGASYAGSIPADLANHSVPTGVAD